ncbi:inhibitor of vertebrate lysozyme family protein [Pseudomonas putida]|nr:inhibitor of vertebrate lysozyme family protein [Pseudomonas putida]
MTSMTFKGMAMALSLFGSTMAMAANDGQARVSGLLGSSTEYRDTWQSVVRSEERLPDWIINLSGHSPEQMTAVSEDGDNYLAGPLCETAESCKSGRLLVAVSLDKEDAYALYVQVPAGLPTDKSPSHHATFRFLGKPDEGMQQMLMEQLKKDPNWY